MYMHFRKALSIVLALVMAMTYLTFPAQAALMGQAKVQLSNPKPHDSSEYTFTMNLGSTHAVKAISMTWLTAATGGSTPNGLATNSPTLATVSANLGATSDWTADFSGIGTGLITLVNTNQASINSGTTISWSVDGIINPYITALGSGTPGCTSTTIAGADGNGSSGTCFIAVQTYNDVAMANGNKKDDVTLTFAVNHDIDVTAKVDPALTFVVTGVNSGVNVATATTTSADTNISTTTNTSTFSSLPFATLTPDTTRLLAQNLYVKTNANNGYVVYTKMTTPLTGTSVNTNNIDPYVGGGADATHPTTWARPTSTTKNVNSGFLGYNTTERDITGVTWSATNWAPLSTADATHEVMESAGQDDGLTATVVSYALEVDVYQPSDSYVGTLQYNCVPKY